MAETGHSRFGGSKADRWLNCPGSVALCETVPALPSSPYAAEGTMAHALAEYALRNGYTEARLAADNTSYAAKDGTPLTFSTEMCEAVQVYLDAVYAEMTVAPDSELYVEQKFTFAMIGDGKEVFGSNDAIVYTPSRARMVVFDYKHGVGVSVAADDNAQLKFYASGALLANPSWTVTDLELVIVQPRARDVDEIGAIRRWPMDLLDVISFTGELALGVQRCKDAYYADRVLLGGPNAREVLKTGSWCRWCDAAAICPAREQESLDAMGLAFEGVKMDEIDATALDDPKTLDVERIAKVMKGIDILSHWANQVREFAEAHLLAGTLEIPGWKVVDKIGRAKWVSSETDIAAYVEMLYGVPLDEILPRKLVTIGDAEKTLRRAGASKEEIDDFKLRYTIKESSGLTIAPSGDRRDAVNAAARNFDGVNV